MRRFMLNIIGNNYDIEIERKDGRRLYVSVNGKRYEASLEQDSGKTMLIAVDGGLYNVVLEGEPSTGKINASVNNRVRMVEHMDFLSRDVAPREHVPLEPKDEVFIDEETKLVPSASMVSGIVAPLPGTVVAVKVNVGDKVNMGDVVVILEAMKMFNELKSPSDGIVIEVNVEVGSNVTTSDLLVLIE